MLMSVGMCPLPKTNVECSRRKCESWRPRNLTPEYKLSKKGQLTEGSTVEKSLGQNTEEDPFATLTLQTSWNQEQTWLSVLTRVLGTSFIFLVLPHSLTQKWMITFILWGCHDTYKYLTPVTCILPKVISFIKIFNKIMRSLTVLSTGCLRIWQLQVDLVAGHTG